MSSRLRRSYGPRAVHRARLLRGAALAGMMGALGLAVATAPPALAATGSGTASGKTVVLGFPVSFPPPCAALTTLAKGQTGQGNPGALNYTETGTGTYTATAGADTATYTGPVSLVLNSTATTAYTGPTGSHGYDSTCNNPAGTPFDVTATTNGTSGSSSVSCTYTGTLSRVNPTEGNGTDRATATLSGDCTVTQGPITVSASPTDEVRDIAYVAGSCVGGPPPITCNVTDTFTATNPPVTLSVTTASPLPAATQGTPYAETLAASGATAPYTWSLAPGSALPSGLTLNSSGLLSGTPTGSGTSTFTVEVADSSSPANTATKSLSLTVNPAPALAIATASPLPPGSQGVAYSESLSASGGVAPYRFSLASGSALPGGLSLSSSGVISGTPTGPATSTFTVDVADSASPAGTASKAFSLAISPPPALGIATASPLPAATLGMPYSQALAAVGGTAPYSWSLASGSALPAGLTLTRAGVLSGTPVVAGTSSFTVKVTDSAHPGAVVTRVLSLTVSATTLVVSNGSGAVTGYPDPPPACTGTPSVCDPAPSPHISGPATNLLGAVGLAQDPAGNLYVASFSPTGQPSIDEYAPGATGDVTPVAILSGPATGLGFSQGIAIDPSGTHLYVVSQTSSVTEYSLPFTGCTGTPPTCDDAPVATLAGPATGLHQPFGISVDAAGNLWVAEIDNAVTEYSLPFTGCTGTPATCDTAPVATLAGPATGVFAPNYALVRGNTLFVTNAGASGRVSITEYPLPLSGCSGTPLTCNEAPSVTLAGASTGLVNPSGMVFDAAGNLFVVNQAGGASPPSSITEYSPAQYSISGDPTPINTIAGAATDLSGPAFIVIEPQQVATTLTATPAIRPGHPSFALTATLLVGGHPLPGQTIVFLAGHTVLCRSTTDALGVATCRARTAKAIQAITAKRGYTATFAANTAYGASQARGVLYGSGRVARGGGTGGGHPSGGGSSGGQTSWNRHGGWT